MLLLVLLGCAMTIDLDPPKEQAPPVVTAEDACAGGEVETTRIDVRFPAREAGCAWGQDGNLEPAQAIVTARAEDHVELDVPAGAALCGLAFDFGGEQTLRYDDSFFLTLDEVVLTASYAPFVHAFEADGRLRLYDWEQLAGTPFAFDDPGAYCLGAGEGLSTCTLPPPETAGKATLDFGDAIVAELAEYAFREGRYTFTFVTVGDNDPELDCSHAAFGFAVDVAYVVTEAP